MNLDDIAKKTHDTAVEKGFWDKERNMGEMLMLATSELAEALEEHRDGNPAVWYLHAKECGFNNGGMADFRATIQPSTVNGLSCTCIPKPEGVAVEVADCIIRCLDIMQHLVSSPEAVVLEKMEYNETRERMHGRAY